MNLLQKLLTLAALVAFYQLGITARHEILVHAYPALVAAQIRALAVAWLIVVVLYAGLMALAYHMPKIPTPAALARACWKSWLSLDSGSRVFLGVIGFWGGVALLCTLVALIKG